MRKSALAVICLIVAAPTSRAMGQDYLNFSFDYTAHAFVDLRGNGDETDSDTQVNAPAHAFIEDTHYEAYADSLVSSGTDAEGLWMETSMSMYPGYTPWVPWTTGSINGTFSIQTTGPVLFSAVAAPTGSLLQDPYFQDWGVEVWDETDPDTILFELGPDNLSSDVVLTGNTDYGVYLHSHSSDHYSLGLDVLFSALAVSGPGDFDGDGDVDADDVDVLCANFGDAAYDLDGDGDCDEDDMIYLVETYVEWDSGAALGTGTFRGDFNLDGEVNGTDLSVMNVGFGTPSGYAAGNANGDTNINGTDLSILAGSFGNIATAAVPEPATMGLLSLGGLVALRRRRQ